MGKSGFVGLFLILFSALAFAKVPVNNALTGAIATVCSPADFGGTCSGGSAWTLTDGTHSVANVGQVTVTGGTVGGTSPNATLTITGGSGASTADHFVTTTLDADLSNATNLGLGSTGLLKSTVAGGVSTISEITDNSANWNTAYGWGNWASNFGTAAGTIAQGNDSRINNGQTAYGWGNPSGVYLPLGGGTLTGDLALTTHNITMTGSLGATGAGKLTKIWSVDGEFTNLPTINGGTLASALSLSSYAPLATPVFTTNITTPLVIGGALTTNDLTLRSNAADLTSGYVHFTDTTTATNATTGAVVMDGGLAVAKKIYATDLQVTNTITGSVSGSAGTAGTAGTVTMAAQTAITSVGTLTGLTTGTILPSAFGTQNLGSATAPWLALFLSDSSVTYYTKFLGGAQSGNITYTLPTAIAAGAGYVLTDAAGNGVLSWAAGGGGAVTAVSNSDGSLTVSPTTGAVVASISAYNKTILAVEAANMGGGA